MDKLQDLLFMLRQKIPFALARFNDGEIQGMKQIGSVAARGDQIITASLQLALIDALYYEQENYWKGLPCPVCMSQHSGYTDKRVPKDYPFLTSAVVLCNKNWKEVIGKIPAALHGRSIVWISGLDQDLDILEEKTGIKVRHHVHVPMRDAWRVYNHVMDGSHLLFREGEVVMMSCGPMSRVLAAKLFEKHPLTTFIDIGSTFDPYTRDVWHGCHKGVFYKCHICGDADAPK